MDLKELLVKEIYETYIKPRVTLIYDNLSSCKEQLFFNNEEALILKLEKTTALTFTTQDKTGFSGDISIEFTTTMNIMTESRIYLVCLSTENVKLILDTEINGSDFVDLEIAAPIISQFDFSSFLNYENYLNLKDENGFCYPITFKLINCEEFSKPKKFRPKKQIENYVKEILNQYSVIEILH
jgi:hypothetical protein